MAFLQRCLTGVMAVGVALACAGVAKAQDVDARRPAPQEPSSVEAGRARWERMSPGERERIARLFEEYRGLPEADRERMRSHLERMAQVRRELEADIPDVLRAKLAQLEPEARRQVLREYLESAMGERTERLRAKLPPEFLQKLEGATPERRAELWSEQRAAWREQGAERALQFLGRQLQLSPEEVERIRTLPPPEKFAAIADLGRREMERRGPPPGVDPQEFRDWLRLPPRECMERMHGHGMRGFRGEPGVRPPWEEREGRGEFGGLDRRGPPPGGRPPEGRPEGRPGEPGHRPPDGERRPPRRESKLSREAQVQFWRAQRPDKEWIVELAAEPRDARRQEVERRIRARVLELLRAQPGLDAAEVERLGSLQGREYGEALRNIVGDPSHGWGWGERRRRDKPRDDAPPGTPPPREN
jgi:hypothetical protein